MGNPVPYGGYGHFIKGAGDLFSVAGNKRHSGAFSEQLGRSCDLFGGEVQLLSDLCNMFFVHRFS